MRMVHIQTKLNEYTIEMFELNYTSTNGFNELTTYGDDDIAYKMFSNSETYIVTKVVHGSYLTYKEHSDMLINGYKLNSWETESGVLKISTNDTDKNYYFYENLELYPDYRANSCTFTYKKK